MKFNFTRALSYLALLFFSMTSGLTFAQNYPTKPITLIVPFAAGGPTDIVARTLAATMSKTVGQTVLVDNKLGAGGTLAAAFVANAQPDGYTLLIHHNGMSTAPALYRKLSFNPLTDFEYIGQVVDVPMTLIARKDIPAKNLQELIAYIKQNSSKINLANAGLGAVSHLCGMLFQKAIGVELTTVPFSGTAPALNALLGGQVDILCDQTTQTTQHIKSGTVKMFGVTTKERIKALPEYPTLSEGGLKDFEVIVWHGVYAPKGTPNATLEKIGNTLRTATKDPSFVAKMADLGAESVSDTKLTSEGLKSWLQTEINKWGPVIKSAGVYSD
jgi:tripartite-type tricarboxylate transporter receptor subunit TctC